jgi:hypothetical protein
MCTEDKRLFRPYSERVFERFWKGELDVEGPVVLASILEEVEADAVSS